jgi:hypothetical protein
MLRILAVEARARRVELGAAAVEDRQVDVHAVERSA